MKGSPLKITIVHHTIALDPELAVWNVIVKSPTGVWHESYGSRGLVDAFVQGVRCGAVQAAGRYDVEVVEERAEARIEST